MTLVLFLSRSPIRKPPTGRMGILDFLFKDNQRDTEVLPGTLHLGSALLVLGCPFLIWQNTLRQREEYSI